MNIRSPRWCASWRAAVVLLALCVAVYVPGLSVLPTIDRDEARFAQASRQMFESVALEAGERDPAAHGGGLVVPMVQDRPRLNKPPLIYWLHAGSAAVFTGGEPGRDAIWMYRVPSLLAAMGSVLLTWRLGVSMFDPRAAFLAGVMLALCPLFVWEARQARADHVLTLCTTAAMMGLWKVWRDGRGRSAWAWVVVLWVSVGLGVLAKGPVTPMVVVLAGVFVSALTRSWGWVRGAKLVAGVGLVAAMVGAWVVMLGEHYGLSRYLAIVYEETLGRAGSARESHWGPPGYHLVLLIVTFWPGSIVTGMAVCRSWGRTIRGLCPWRWRATARTRGRSAEVFCLGWIVPSWVVFELVATKLPHYPMVVFPALALLSGRTLLAVSTGRARMGWGRLASVVYVLWVGVTAVVAVGAVGASLLLFDRSWQGSVPVAMGVAIAAVLVQGWLVGRVVARLVRRRIAGAFRAAAMSAVVLWVLLLGLIVPRCPSLWATRAVVRTLESAGWTADQPLATLYHEDSLIFETRGAARRMDGPRELVEFMRANPGAAAVARERDEAELEGLSVVGFVRGFNIARAARERLVILRAGAAEEAGQTGGGDDSGEREPQP